MSNPPVRSLARACRAAALLLCCAASAAAAATAHRSALFDSTCSMCHQLGATGVPGEFPRLAGRIGKIAATAAGRNYLEHVLLYGMMGTIRVDGTPIVGGVMPSFSSLSNKQLAAALNYVASLDATGKLKWRGPVFKPADFARVRAGKPCSPRQVHRLRTRVLGKANS